MVKNGDINYAGGALTNFWRSAENLSITQKMMWAVSQGCSLRRILLNGNLQFYQYNKGQLSPGYASGGFMADVEVLGTVE